MAMWCMCMQLSKGDRHITGTAVEEVLHDMPADLAKHVIFQHSDAAYETCSTPLQL